MHNYKAVSVYSEVAYNNGKKVKDVEIVKENNNGVIRQYVKGMSPAATIRNKRVRFNVQTAKTQPSLGITFRRMPTPYFTRNNKRKAKSLRKHRK